MRQNPSEANEEIHRILWNPKISPLAYTQSQKSPFHTPYSRSLKIHYIIHPYVCLPSGFFLSGFLIQTLYAFLCSHACNKPRQHMYYLGKVKNQPDATHMKFI
jgi:hypothetical protein